MEKSYSRHVKLTKKQTIKLKKIKLILRNRKINNKQVNNAK